MDSPYACSVTSCAFPCLTHAFTGAVPGGVRVACGPIALEVAFHLGPRAAAVLGPIPHLPAVAVTRLVVFPAAARAPIALLPPLPVARHRRLPGRRASRPTDVHLALFA